MPRYLITQRVRIQYELEADSRKDALWLIDEPKIRKENYSTEVLGTGIVEIGGETVAGEERDVHS